MVIYIKITKINELSKYIGNTKTHLAVNIMKHFNLKSNIYLKLEKDNYSGSIKDRIVYYIIKDAIEKGIINTETVIVEATSGNTGISISAISNYLGLKSIIVMPETSSIERSNLIKKYGGEVILTPKELGMKGCIQKVKELKLKYENTFEINQFNNELCVQTHYVTTAREIYNEIPDIDIFISTQGTGATFTGCVKYLKEQKQIKSILVTPDIYPHKIEGIDPGFIPSIFDQSLIDEKVQISYTDAYNYTNLLYKEENIKCGISSGASLHAAVNIAKKYPNQNIVVILPDDGNRYISTGVFNELKSN